jgi:hypothetical protein
MTRSDLILAASLVSITPAAAAGNTPITCPAQLAAEAVQVAHPAPGWTGFVPTFFLLESVGVTTGPLQERAILRGEQQKLTGKAYRVSFPLDDSPGEKWLMCEYARSQIVQAQRLPDDTSRCDVLYTPDKHGGFTIQTTCQAGRGVR